MMAHFITQRLYASFMSLPYLPYNVHATQFIYRICVVREYVERTTHVITVLFTLGRCPNRSDRLKNGVFCKIWDEDDCTGWEYEVTNTSNILFVRYTV